MSDEAGSSGVQNVTENKVEGENEEKQQQVEDDDEQAVTMLDVLEEENDLEADANAVLGGSDDQNCTYDEGYIPRQALYACMTCIPLCEETDFKPAGVCLACSYNCHEGHDLVELYTKRFFRCDCGNSRFGENKCNLQPEKDEENENNKYNQNFKGVYCICARPYPDPDDTVDDEMLQCIVCEDWFHGRHLDVPRSTKLMAHNFCEMICGTCIEKHPILWHYVQEVAVSGDYADASIVDVCGDCDKTDESFVESGAPKTESQAAQEDNGEAKVEESAKSSAEKMVDKSETKPDEVEAKPEEVEAKPDEVEAKSDDVVAKPNEVEAKPDEVVAKPDEIVAKPNEVEAKPDDNAETVAESNDEAKLDTKQEKMDPIDDDEKPKAAEIPTKCLISGKEEPTPQKMAVLWPNGWRQKLCICEDCKVIYKEKGVEFLIDESDMVQFYEEQGKIKIATSGTQYEQGMRALSNMDRIRQLDAIEEYNKMQVKLKEYLADFAAQNRVVREEDIRGFFDNLQANKKRRLETGVQYLCR